MIDYYEVLPDVTYLLNKHFTPGRGGAKIEYITRHHLAMVGEVEAVVDRVWNTRQASAHYVVGPGGRVGQAVYDGNTAWSNANAYSNARSIAIEHSNSAGANADWPISNATLISGARLAAALCRFYKLGRPQFGKNIRDHREFGQTSCPHHLAHGGKYHKLWMDEAQRFYDLLMARKVTEMGDLIMPEDKETDMSFTAEDRRLLKELHAERKKIHDIHHELTHRFDSRYDLDRLKRGEIEPNQVYSDTLVGYVLNTDNRSEQEYQARLAAESKTEVPDNE